MFHQSYYVTHHPCVPIHGWRQLASRMPNPTVRGLRPARRRFAAITHHIEASHPFLVRCGYALVGKSHDTSRKQTCNYIIMMQPMAHSK